MIVERNIGLEYYALFSLDNGVTIINPYNIVIHFNNYFVSIAETSKQSIKYSAKHFLDYLANENGSTMFLQPAYKKSNTTSGQSSILYRKLFLKNEISKQLEDLPTSPS